MQQVFDCHEVNQATVTCTPNAGVVRCGCLSFTQVAFRQGPSKQGMHTSRCESRRLDATPSGIRMTQWDLISPAVKRSDPRIQWLALRSSRSC